MALHLRALRAAHDSVAHRVHAIRSPDAHPLCPAATARPFDRVGTVVRASGLGSCRDYIW